MYRIPLKYFTGIILIFLFNQTHKINAQDLIIEDTTISSTTKLTAGNSIKIGPNVKISNTGDLSLETKKVYVQPEFHIIRGGRLTVITNTHIVNINNDQKMIPDKYTLLQNYPNPFNPETVIKYQLPENSKVILKIFDVTGRYLSTLVKEYQKAGSHSVIFNATDLPSGVYFYQLVTKSYVKTRKLILLK